MPNFTFSKLVREKIVDRQAAEGVTPTYRQLNAIDHKRELINKLFEEAKEIEEASPNEIIEEIADVQQVIDDLLIVLQIKASEVAVAQLEKNKKNGSFAKGVYIETVNVDESNKWTKYYRQNSDRYPEST